MDHAERLAQAIIETVLPGSQMSYRPDQSHGIHDFDLRLPDGRVSAVELTASVDQNRAQTAAAILDPQKGGSTIRAKLCSKTWLIWPSSAARINLIREKVDKYLAVIEAEGIEKFWGPTDCHQSIERIYEDLQVRSGQVLSWEQLGYIRISLPNSGGAVGPRLVDEAVRLEAYKADHRGKLGRAGTDERHLAVYVSLENTRMWCALVDFSPERTLPELPSEITHVWAFTEANVEHHCVVWHANLRSPWSRLDLKAA
jgi:hypothetical protein